MPGYPGGIWRGAQDSLLPLKVLGEAEDGGSGRRVIRSNLPRKERGHPVQPTFIQHFQCGDGHSGLPLKILVGGGT